MENTALYLVVTFIAALIILNLIATYIVLHTYFEVKERKKNQLIFVWLLPIIGGILAIYLNREDYFEQKQVKKVGNNSNITENEAINHGRAYNHFNR